MTTTKLNIWVVDDESMIRELVEKIVEHSGHRATAFETGTEAVAALNNELAKCDLLIVDLNLDDISGLDLIAEFRSVKPVLPCIISTGDALKIDQVPKDLQNNTFILPKPYRARELSDLVASIFAPTA